VNEKKRLWYAQNKEKVKAYRLENVERLNESKRLHRISHAEQRAKYRKWYYDNHKEHELSNNSRYMKTHPENKRAKEHRHKALKKGAPGTYSAADIIDKRYQQKNCCYWCGNALDRYDVDHVIPLARKGSNWPDNIVIACHSCNSQKSDKIPYLNWTPPAPLYDPDPQRERIFRLLKDQSAEGDGK
jgi:5-methylcytosine-specific restriction endonuclease McrA